MSLLAKRLLLAAGATCIAALLGWAVLMQTVRLRTHHGLWPPFHPGRDDALYGWVLLPDFHGRHQSENFDVDVRTNAFGLRGPPCEPAKAPGVRRILLLGDSFAFGWGVAEDQTFAARLSSQLAAAGRPVEIIDSGVPGWNAADEYLWLKTTGFDFQPDVVLLQLCSNDLVDFIWFQLDLDAQNLPVAIRPRPRLTNAERRQLLAEAASRQGVSVEELAAHASQEELDHLAADGMGPLAAGRRASAGAPPPGPIASLSADEIRRGLDTGPEFQARYLAYLVDAIHALCEARGIPLRLLCVDAATLDDDAARPALEALCAAADGHCLSSATFLAREDFGDFFFPRDPHWTPGGHRRAGDALAAWLLADRELDLGPP